MTVNTSRVESPADFGSDPAGVAKRWLTELDIAQKAFDKWIERGRKVVKRYRDERDDRSGQKFNILWSNVKTIKPSVYAKRPKPVVSRRFKDSDAVGRVAAMLLERTLESDLEIHSDLDSSMKAVVEDRLLPGRGVAWVRYDPTIETAQLTDDVTGEAKTDEQGQPMTEERVTYECAPLDYVHWTDFIHSPARTWEEVRWGARRVYKTRDELRERFGQTITQFKGDVEQIPLDYKPSGMDTTSYSTPEHDAYKKAIVYEVWDKQTKYVFWMVKGYDFPLDIQPDPLGLENFFPFPMPVFATTTTDDLVPVPDFTVYQDQAEELDTITGRINLLVQACRVVGVYAGKEDAVKRIFDETDDNCLIPVDNWAMFSEQGGVKGVIDWVPLDMVQKVLAQLYISRDACKQTIYEIMGMSDIVRGASNPEETATAQQIKAQFGSIRLRETQGDVNRFARDAIQLKAEIVCKHYQPQTILMMSGAEFLEDADKPLVPEAIDLLKAGKIMQFRIDVETDSMIEVDEAEQKKSTTEYVAAVGTFLKEALPVVQMAPPLGPYIAETLKFVARTFRAGRDLEGVLDQALSQLMAPPMMPGQPGQPPMAPPGQPGQQPPGPPQPGQPLQPPGPQGAMPIVRSPDGMMAGMNTPMGPIQFLRGPDGKAIAVRLNGVDHAVSRGPDGQPLGLQQLH